MRLHAFALEDISGFLYVKLPDLSAAQDCILLLSGIRLYAHIQKDPLEMNLRNSHLLCLSVDHGTRRASAV